MDVFIISSLPSLCWRHCKWQGPFAPQTLLRFIATTDPAATLSSSADFPVSPVIRPTLLRRFRAGTRRASPVAQHVLVTVLSLPPRRGEHPYRSVFGCSCGLRPPVEGSQPDRRISRIRLSDKTSRLRVQRLLRLLNIYRS